MRIYVIHYGRKLKYKKNEKMRMRVVCKKGCPFEAYCAKIKAEDT